jgi:hypothetical protein
VWQDNQNTHLFKVPEGVGSASKESIY